MSVGNTLRRWKSGMTWLGGTVLHGPTRPVVPTDAHMRAMEWEHHDEDSQRASFRTMVAALPSAVGTVARMSWEVAPTVTIAALVMGTLSGVASATGLLTANRVLLGLFATGPTPDKVMGALGQLAVLAVAVAAKAALVSAVTACGARLGPGVRRLAESRLVEAASFVRLRALDDAAYHDELSRACERSLPMFEQAVTQCTGLLTAGIGLVAAVVTVGFFNPVLPVVVLISGLPAGYAALRSARLRHRSLHEVVAFDRRVRMVTSLLTDRESAAELRVFGAQPSLLAEHERISRLRERVDSYVGLAQEYHAVLGRSATGVATVGVYGVLAWLLHDGQIPLASAATAVLALQAAHTAMGQVAQAVNKLHEQGLFILDYEAVLADCREHAPTAAAVAEVDPPRLIELDRVSFCYPGAVRPALSGVSATIQAGQVVALVGENGSGKTTLSKLLAGLYEPDEGEIRWDGVSLTQLRPEAIAGRVSVIMQQPTRWPLTARAAATLGVPPEAVDVEHLESAARAAGADAVIAELPDGWDTLLSKQFKHGSDLSGGQWQRLAGARALYRRPAILIADEPTANLDAKAEARFYETIAALAGDHTVILVTHRLGTVRMADLILVLDQGELVESGDHDTLISAGGRYAELYNLQSRLYAEEWLPADSPSA